MCCVLCCECVDQKFRLLGLSLRRDGMNALKEYLSGYVVLMVL